MPLSEHEQRLLAEMERNLYKNDADFVAKVGRRDPRVSYRMIVVGVLVVVVGLSLLLTGVFLKSSVVGIIGFACMLGGVLLMMSPGRGRFFRHGKSAETFGSDGVAGSKSSDGFINRMNDRWDKRQGK